jgi:hypothetical protein
LFVILVVDGDVAGAFGNEDPCDSFFPAPNTVFLLFHFLAISVLLLAISYSAANG